MEEIKYKRKFTKLEAAKFIKQTLYDGEIKYINIVWQLDEQQADSFHHDWTTEKFVAAVKILVNH